MKKLLVLLIATCFCLVSSMALAGNTNPTLYLEIYMYDYDPDDPGPAPAELCFHNPGPPVGELPCYSPKAPYRFGIVPLHIGKLDLPIAVGWPPPIPTGGGYAGVAYGVASSGVAVLYLSFMACPGFNQGPGTAPGAIVAAAFTQCQDWMDHPGYCKYISTENVGATYFDVVNNAEEGKYVVINCQLAYDVTSIGGRAQWGVDPTGVDLSTWGKIKGLYR
jgi:hypothetical protein